MSDHTPVPGRYSVLALVFVSYLLCYMDRMVIASAVPFMAKDLGLDGIQTGFVLSSFFIGYAFMQFPGGILSDRYGPRLVIIVSMIGWSVFTGLTGMAAGFLSLVLVRVVFGLFEGAFPAAASKSIVLWFPIAEVGRANGAKLPQRSSAPRWLRLSWPPCCCCSVGVRCSISW
jgi:MFS family permease